MLEEAPVAKGYAKLFENFEEVPKAEQCQITGEIPKWLKGTLLRNGPGMFKVGDTQYNHWFDGLAYIQRYHFENGKMFYSAKYLRSEAYERNTAAQRIVVGEFGTAKYPDPCKNIFHRYFSYFFENHTTDNGVVNFFKAGDAIFACTETPKLNQIDPKTLETGAKVNFDDYVAVNIVTAHQHTASDGSVLNVGSKFGRNAYYVFTKTDPPSEEDRQDATKVLQSTSAVGRIKLDEPMMPCYYHSFGMSENHMVLFESPLRINIYTILGAQWR
ncbi:CBN-BCMO-2 protein, partial [Aphelenchoides avenae]